jgi:hypothetical protein
MRKDVISRIFSVIYAVIVLCIQRLPSAVTAVDNRSLMHYKTGFGRLATRPNGGTEKTTGENIVCKYKISVQFCYYNLSLHFLGIDVLRYLVQPTFCNRRITCSIMPDGENMCLCDLV